MGPDSLGIIIGALLTRAGYDITLIDANVAYVKALNLKGSGERKSRFCGPDEGGDPE
jgi:hypothetical protein